MRAAGRNGRGWADLTKFPGDFRAQKYMQRRRFWLALLPFFTFPPGANASAWTGIGNLWRFLDHDLPVAVNVTPGA